MKDKKGTAQEVPVQEQLDSIVTENGNNKVTITKESISYSFTE